MCWLRPVFNKLQLEGFIKVGWPFSWVEVRTYPSFLFMSVLQVLILIRTCFSAFTGNRLSFRKEDEIVLFLFVCVCIKKAQCGVRPGLYCTTLAFPCQQEEGCWIQPIHRCMCLCSVFAIERTQEALWSWLKRCFVRRYTWCFPTPFSYPRIKGVKEVSEYLVIFY